jgi:hypothetical protein
VARDSSVIRWPRARNGERDRWNWRHYTKEVTTVKTVIALFLNLALVACATTGSQDNPIKNWLDTGAIHYGSTKAEVAPLVGEPPYNCRKTKVTVEGEKELWDMASQGCARDPSQPYVLIFNNGKFSEIRWSCPSYAPRLFESF